MAKSYLRCVCKMIEANVTRIDEQNVELSFTVPAESVDKAYAKAYARIAATYKFDGFRKGKVPREIINKVIGIESINAQVLQDMLPDAYDEAVEKTDIIPVAQPEFDPWPTITPGQQLDVKIKLGVLPEFTVADYTTIPLPFGKEIEVTEEDIDNVVERMRKYAIKYDELTEPRPCADGDLVTAEADIFEIREDGSEELLRAVSRPYSFVIGEGEILEDIEKQIVGMSLDESKSFTISYPQDFDNAILAGKKTKHIATVNEIRATSRPTNDEEFLARIEDGKYSSMDDLRTNVKNHLQSQKEQERDNEVIEAVFSHIMDGTALDIPQTLLDDEIEYRQRMLQQVVEARGMTLEQLAQMRGMDIDQLIESENHRAADEVKKRIIINRIFTDENLSITVDEFERFVLRYAMDNYITPAHLKKMMRDREFVAMMRQKVREAKTVSMLMERVKYQGEA